MALVNNKSKLVGQRVEKSACWVVVKKKKIQIIKPDATKMIWNFGRN